MQEQIAKRMDAGHNAQKDIVIGIRLIFAGEKSRKILIITLFG